MSALVSLVVASAATKVLGSILGQTKSLWVFRYVEKFYWVFTL